MQLLLRYRTQSCGGCKIVLHPDWHTRFYPASMFTTAPLADIRAAIATKRVRNSSKDAYMCYGCVYVPRLCPALVDNASLSPSGAGKDLRDAAARRGAPWPRWQSGWPLRGESSPFHFILRCFRANKRSYVNTNKYSDDLSKISVFISLSDIHLHATHT